MKIHYHTRTHLNGNIVISELIEFFIEILTLVEIIFIKIHFHTNQLFKWLISTCIKRKFIAKKFYMQARLLMYFLKLDTKLQNTNRTLYAQKLFAI